MEFAFIVTAEERAEIEAAMEMAERIDPVIPNDMKKSARNKEIALRFAREFMATYSLKEDEYENESANVI